MQKMMSGTCILTGMILKTMPVGEYDKRITLLTLERGKISAFARGARRPKGALQAATGLFCFGKFEAYEGRNSYTVVKAEIRNYFREMAGDLDKTCYGSYFLEFADYFSQENSDASDQLKLLYRSLLALSVPSLDHRLVRCIYELKTLVFHGVYPNVFSCAVCGSVKNLRWFHVQRRGVLCDECKGQTAAFPLDEAALYTLQYIISSPLKELYTFTVTEPVLRMVQRIVRAYTALYVEREFKSLAFLPEG